MTSLLRHTFCFVTATLLLLAACTPSPSHPQESDELPPMYPDYTDVTIPCNIAPLNFLLRGGYEAVELKAVCGDKELLVLEKGEQVCIDADDWSNFLQAAAGRQATVTVTALKDGTWTAFKPFKWTVANDKTCRCANGAWRISTSAPSPTMDSSATVA